MSETEQEENWKDKYFKTLLEQEEQEKQFSEKYKEIYSELLNAFFHYKGKDPKLDDALLDLPTKGDAENISIRVLKDINHQIGKIDDLLSRGEKAIPNEKSEDKPEQKSVEASTDFDAAKDIIEHLLQRLPAEVSSKLEQDDLEKQLEEAKDSNALKTITESIKDCILETLSEQNKLIKDLSSFLGGISERLLSVKTHLQDEKGSRAESSSDRGDLTRFLEGNLKKIRQSVADADDVAILQKSIEKQIDEIDGKVTSFAEKESERADHAEKASHQLENQIQKLESESEQLRKSLEAAKEEAVIDQLTGIPNRRAYDTRMEVEYSRWQRDHRPLTMAIMDIDRFKSINDKFGHPIGDKVLKEVSERVQQEVRKSDFFGRIGGEEFVFLLVGSSLESSKVKAESLRNKVEECNFRVKKKRFKVTMSIGIAEFKGKDTVEEVYSRADAALLKAKETGRNKCLTELDLK